MVELRFQLKVRLQRSIVYYRRLWLLFCAVVQYLRARLEPTQVDPPLPANITVLAYYTSD